MAEWVSFLLEILKITIPAVAVLLTAWIVLKTYLDKRLQMMALEQRGENKKETISIRLNAYERLILFLERIDILQMLMRTPAGQMTAQEYRGALLVTIQREYEHNISQQLYVSNQLWQIINIARMEISNRISEIPTTEQNISSGRDFADALVGAMEKWENNPLPKAKEAVRTEAGILL